MLCNGHCRICIQCEMFYLLLAMIFFGLKAAIKMLEVHVLNWSLPSLFLVHLSILSDSFSLSFSLSPLSLPALSFSPLAIPFWPLSFSSSTNIHLTVFPATVTHVFLVKHCSFHPSPSCASLKTQPLQLLFAVAICMASMMWWIHSRAHNIHKIPTPAQIT